MGYTANTVDVDFTVPKENVADALAAFNAIAADMGAPWPSSYTSLTDAADEYAGFQCSDLNGGVFALGFHADSWWEERAVGFLTAIAPFAVEGSYVRLQGEDETLWGYRVHHGQLLDEAGHIEWELC